MARGVGSMGSVQLIRGSGQKKKRYGVKGKKKKVPKGKVGKGW